MVGDRKLFWALFELNICLKGSHAQSFYLNTISALMGGDQTNYDRFPYCCLHTYKPMGAQQSRMA
jgi:hypothetical protein